VWVFSKLLTENLFFLVGQKISYGKGKSDIISRLDGTAKMPEVNKGGESGGGASTELQKSIFNAPGLVQGLPPIPPTITPSASVGEVQAQATQGTKRRREDESDAEEDGGEKTSADVAMEVEEDDEDDEGEAMMEESDED